jgi:hypothetical protein
MKLFSKITSTLAVLVLAAATMFAQDGRTKINYYNQSSQTVRMLIDGRPACTGDVIPGGACTEIVNPGTYLLQATNGQQTTGGYTCAVEYGSYCNYTVTEHTADLKLTPGLSMAAYTPVVLLNYGRFNANVPVQLTKNAPTNGTTDFGKPYTSTFWSAELTNGDSYMVGISDYGFATAQEDLAKVTNGYATALKGTITKQDFTTVSGYPAVMSFIDSSSEGHNFRSALLVVVKGNSAYMFAFMTDLATPGTDNDAVKTFFTSVAIN